jgi:tetratricopeptide (TPR) repeat protein
MADFITPYERYYEEALRLLKSGRSMNDILKYINAIEDENYRDGTLGKMAGFLATHGKVEEAQQFCSAVRNPLEHADALFDVGRELRKNDRLESAKDVFRQAIEAAEKLRPDAWETPTIFLQIADELWNLGEQNEAIELLRRAVELGKRSPQHFESSKTLAGCARVLSRWGYKSEALDVAKTIESPEQRNAVLEELGKPPSSD